jgi:hypothetical protein
MVVLSLQVIFIPRLRPSGSREWSSGRLIWFTQFPYLMLARPDHVDWRPDVWILNGILALWMSASGRESTSSKWLQQSSHNCVLERNPKACRTLRFVRTCCWNVRTDISWSSSKLLGTKEGLDGKFSSSGRMMVWTVGRPDGMTRRPDGWQGTEFFWLVNCTESFGSTLNSGIPVEKHLYKEVILSNRMWPITNCFLKNKIGYDGMFVVDCVGGSGGLILLWKKFMLLSKIIAWDI